MLGYDGSPFESCESTNQLTYLELNFPDVCYSANIEGGINARCDFHMSGNAKHLS